MHAAQELRTRGTRTSDALKRQGMINCPEEREKSSRQEEEEGRKEEEEELGGGLNLGGNASVSK